MTYKGSGHGNTGKGVKTPPDRRHVRDIMSNHSNGFPIGTEIMTADGVLPVEYLEPGDRVITRNGMRTLQGIDTPAPLRFKLIFEHEEVVYAGGLMVMSETGLPFAA